MTDFTEGEKENLFACVTELKVLMARVDERLKVGEENFMDNKEQHAAFMNGIQRSDKHIDRHKTVRWVISGIIAVCGSAAIFWERISRVF
jgi:hypothetical protein